MAQERRWYKWFYDNIQSRYYNLLVRWCFLPFGGDERCRDKLIEDIEFSTKEAILDMCCGTGGVTFAIAKRIGRECEIIGIDLSSGQINIAQRSNRFANIKFIEGDVVSTSFEDECFNKVFIAHALHEMPREIRLEVLVETKRVLEEKGKVIVLELNRPEDLFIRLFTGFWFFYWLPFNFETPTRRDMLRRGLVNEVKEAGFKDIKKISKYKGIFQIVVGEK
ncbi:TPA: hypothetical protein DCX15_03205 [bacterium]|nr:hypothetical protein [bacterium]